MNEYSSGLNRQSSENDDIEFALNKVINSKSQILSNFF